MKYTDSKHGRAEYGQYVQISKNYWDALEQEPLSGLALKDQYFAQMVHVTNAIPLSAGDIQIGAVEIKDHDSETRLDIETDNTKGAAFVQSESLALEDTQSTILSAMQNSNLINIENGLTQTEISETLSAQSDLFSLESTQSDVLSTLQNLDVSSTNRYIAETTVPTAVADGETVNTWSDEYGRQVLAGYNLALNGFDTNQVNQALLNRLGPITNLNAVTSTGAGTSLDISNYHNITTHIVASSVTSGATIDIQHSLDGTNWANISQNIITENGVTEVVMENKAYKYLRTNATSYLDGTYTTQVYCGN